MPQVTVWTQAMQLHRTQPALHHRRSEMALLELRLGASGCVYTLAGSILCLCRCCGTWGKKRCWLLTRAPACRMHRVWRVLCSWRLCLRGKRIALGVEKNKLTRSSKSGLLPLNQDPALTLCFQDGRKLPIHFAKQCLNT